MILVTVIGYFVFLAITRVTSGNGSKLDHYICYGTLAGFVVILILGVLDTKKDKKALAAKRQNWKDTCKSGEVAIVNRHYYPGGTNEDENGIPHTSRASYHLDLEMNADQRAAAPDRKVLYVEVSGSVYGKLLERNTVRIYYKPEAPLTFLLEEEL